MNFLCICALFKTRDIGSRPWYSLNFTHSFCSSIKCSFSYILANFFFALWVDSTLKHSVFNCSLYAQEKVEEGGVENWKNDKNEL